MDCRECGSILIEGEEESGVCMGCSDFVTPFYQALSRLTEPERRRLYMGDFNEPEPPEPSARVRQWRALRELLERRADISTGRVLLVDKREWDRHREELARYRDNKERDNSPSLGGKNGLTGDEPMLGSKPDSDVV